MRDTGVGTCPDATGLGAPDSDVVVVLVDEPETTTGRWSGCCGLRC